MPVAGIFNFSIFNNAIFNTGTPVGPTVNWQGDGISEKKRKRRRREYLKLFDDIEQTLREMVFGLEPTPARVVATALQPVVPKDVTQDVVEAFRKLQALAEDDRALTARLAQIERDLRAYETQAQRALNEEEDEAMMVLA
jgi:hypothetical protein